MPELEAGASLQRSSEKRITELTHLSTQGELLSTYPIRCRDGKEVSLLRLLPDYEHHGKYAIKIKFRPIWNKTFTLCSSRKDTILALIIELNEDGSEERTKQYWVDLNGVREARLTTKGNGCDPKVIEASETALADILIESHNNHVVHAAAQFLKERYK
jgi:hypothetical protein